jgi:hypothetical protein
MPPTGYINASLSPEAYAALNMLAAKLSLVKGRRVSMSKAIMVADRLVNLAAESHVRKAIREVFEA